MSSALKKDEFYLARAGRFNVDAHLGWTTIEAAVRPTKTEIPALSHSQVQTLLGAIGAAKNFDIKRPTFQRSGLSDLCTFLEYSDVYEWHTRIRRR
ncbi:MAG: hypothetical protein WAP47_12770 [Candidatus Rokuibacteriota bacterium]